MTGKFNAFSSPASAPLRAPLSAPLSAPLEAIYDVDAPAKLNLFLHVTGQRADGYHLLQSAFMLIDWCDTLHFELRHDGQITREDLGDALPAQDLMVRAAQALQTQTASPFGVHMGVKKNIPFQAGLGGGSSDAASTLLALNRLWNLKLPLATLVKLGLSLGADVPFFLSGGAAWVEGIGESITPITLPQARFMVLKPPAGLGTAEVFSHPKLKRDTKTAIISGFAKNPFGFGQNDLQEVAQSLCPGVGEGLDWLGSLGLLGRLTGSGSAIFALLGSVVASRVDAEKLIDLATLPPGFLAKLCCNLDRHPQAGWAD